MPVTMMRLNMVKGLGPTLQIAEGWTIALPDEVTDTLWKRTDYTWPCTWFAPRVTGKGAFKTAYDVMNNWGRKSRRNFLWPYRRRPNHDVFNAPNSRMYA